jgi:phenylalanyl-tRNA synthetase alpha subunit
MRQRTASVANIPTNTSTITTIPEAPPLPTSLSAVKAKTSWPSPSTVLNTNTSNISTSSNPSESLNNSTNETRRRKTSSSDNKSPRKDSDSHQQQQQSFDSSDGSAPQSPTTGSSIHFIQRTLNQHALQAIAKGRLRHLGYMAANITDFDLLNWLKTHKYENRFF